MTENPNYRKIFNDHFNASESKLKQLKLNIKTRELTNNEDLNNKEGLTNKEGLNNSERNFTKEDLNNNERSFIKEKSRKVQFILNKDETIKVTPSNNIISKYLARKFEAKYFLKENCWVINESLYSGLVKELTKNNVIHEKLNNAVIKTIRKTIPDNKYDLSDEIFSKLMPFQKEAVIYTLNRDGRVLLADDMGLGKTIQAIAIAQYYSFEFPLLVICPASLCDNWKDSFFTFLNMESKVVKTDNDLLTDNRIFIISYNLSVKCISNIELKSFRIIICDECHYLKTFKSKRTTELLPILQSSTRLIMISGTPALSRPMELYPIISAINKSLFTNFRDYGMRYCGGRRINNYYDFRGYSHPSELSYILEKDMMIRRLKVNVLQDLPPKTRRRILLKNNETKLKDKVNINEDSIKGKSFIDLQGIENNTDIMKKFNQAAVLKQKPVCEYLESFLEKNIKFLIFAHHIDMLNCISVFLKEKKVKFIRIDGSFSVSKRFALVEDFQSNDEIRVAVLSITAASTGLNLTAGIAVVFAELFWNPGVMLQAEDRIHRIGQVNCVDIHYLICKNTIDELVWPILLNKLNVLEKLNISKNELKKINKS